MNRNALNEIVKCFANREGLCMLKIAICDDEVIYKENTEKECKSYFHEETKYFAEEVVFFTFSSGNELINSAEEYDILFLDVEMPDGDGIRVKEYFEKNKKNTRIIFLTSHEERAIEAFGKNVLCFLRKPIKEEKFHKALEKALSDIRGTVLEVEENGKVILLPIQQIKYIEVQDKYTIVFAETGSYLLRKTMRFWEEQLSNQYFCRIHKSFLVNLDFFVKEKDEVVLDKNKRVRISRKNKEKVMNEYKEYIRQKAREM